MNRISLDELADCLERVLGAIDLGNFPLREDLAFMRGAIASLRSPLSAEELQGLCEMATGIRAAALELKTHRN